MAVQMRRPLPLAPRSLPEAAAAIRLLEAGRGGHWITIEQDGEYTHIFISGGGIVTKGPKHLIGARAGHLPPIPGHRNVTHHPEGYEPAGARSHPSYAEHKTPEGAGGGGGGGETAEGGVKRAGRPYARTGSKKEEEGGGGGGTEKQRAPRTPSGPARLSKDEAEAGLQKAIAEKREQWQKAKAERQKLIGGGGTEKGPTATPETPEEKGGGQGAGVADLKAHAAATRALQDAANMHQENMRAFSVRGAHANQRLHEETRASAAALRSAMEHPALGKTQKLFARNILQVTAPNVRTERYPKHEDTTASFAALARENADALERKKAEVRGTTGGGGTEKAAEPEVKTPPQTPPRAPEEKKAETPTARGALPEGVTLYSGLASSIGAGDDLVGSNKYRVVAVRDRSHKSVRFAVKRRAPSGIESLVKDGMHADVDAANAHLIRLHQEAVEKKAAPPSEPTLRPGGIGGLQGGSAEPEVKRPEDPAARHIAMLDTEEGRVALQGMAQRSFLRGAAPKDTPENEALHTLAIHGGMRPRSPVWSEERDTEEGKAHRAAIEQHIRTAAQHLTDQAAHDKTPEGRPALHRSMTSALTETHTPAKLRALYKETFPDRPALPKDDDLHYAVASSIAAHRMGQPGLAANSSVERHALLHENMRAKIANKEALGIEPLRPGLAQTLPKKENYRAIHQAVAETLQKHLSPAFHGLAQATGAHLHVVPISERPAGTVSRVKTSGSPSGTYFPGNNMIHVYSDGSWHDPEYSAKTAIHEVGHHVDRVGHNLLHAARGDLSDRADFQKIFKAHRNNAAFRPYYREHPSEMFAESFAEHMRDPNRGDKARSILATHYKAPELHDYMENLRTAVEAAGSATGKGARAPRRAKEAAAYGGTTHVGAPSLGAAARALDRLVAGARGYGRASPGVGRAMITANARPPGTARRLQEDRT